MKILLDENISYRMVKLLEKVEINCSHVSRIDTKQPPSDKIIWRYAKANNFMIFSFDEDFNQLSNIHGFPPKVVFFRFGNTPTKKLFDLIQTNLKAINSFYKDAEIGILEMF